MLFVVLSTMFNFSFQCLPECQTCQMYNAPPLVQRGEAAPPTTHFDGGMEELVIDEVTPIPLRFDLSDRNMRFLDRVDMEMVAPDVMIIPDLVKETSWNSETVEKVHENERLSTLELELQLQREAKESKENETMLLQKWF